MNSFLSKNTFGSFLIFLPVALYFYFLSEYAINIPKWDDHALKAFIVEFNNSHGFIPKFQTFFKQHNEHRIAFDRFFTLIVYWINGSIEYRWLMWIGNFTLLGLLFIFYKIFQTLKISIAYFVPIPFILFQLQLWENTYWGMAALQNFGIIFFVFSLIYLICSEKRRAFYVALLVAFLATYTSGNGITIFPVCIFLLIIQRRFKDALVFSSISAILVFLYFYNYKFPENNPLLDGIGIQKMITGFFIFLGSVFDLLPNASQNNKIIIFSGFTLFVISSILAVYLISISKLFKKQRNLNHIELFILGSIMFLIGTAIVVTITRISYGEVSLLTSRYKIYSILLLITIYLAVISKINFNYNNWIAISVIFLAICFNMLANYTYLRDVVNFRNQLISFGINWKLDETISETTTKIKLYDMPYLSIKESISEFRKPIKNTKVWEQKISKSVNSDGILIQNNSVNPPTEKEDNISLILQSVNRTYLMPTQLMNYPLNAFLRTGQYWQNGFVGVLNNNEFESGTYYIGLFIKNRNTTQKYYLNDSLIINHPKSKPLKTNW